MCVCVKIHPGMIKCDPIIFLPLTSKCNLDLAATDLSLAHDTSTHDGKHFCQ